MFFFSKKEDTPEEDHDPIVTISAPSSFRSSASFRPPSSPFSSSSSSPLMPITRPTEEKKKKGSPEEEPEVRTFTVGGCSFEGESVLQRMKPVNQTEPFSRADQPTTTTTGGTEVTGFEDGDPLLLHQHQHQHQLLYYAVPHGVGKLVSRDSQRVVYSGYWKKGYRDGSGTGEVSSMPRRGGFMGGFASPSFWEQDTDEEEGEEGEKEEEEHGGRKKVFGVYEGSWKKGTFHGRGKFTSTEGEVIQGEWNADQPWSCRGKFTAPSGFSFDGIWASGFFTGKARMRFPDGVAYSGDIKNGKREGHGEETDPTGAKYVGFWKEDKRLFCGRHIWPSGKIEEREYKLDVLVQTSSTLPSEAEKELVVTNKKFSELRQNMDTQSNYQVLLGDLKSELEKLKKEKEEWQKERDSWQKEKESLDEQKARAEAKVEEESYKNTCQICLDKPRDALIMPCCHFLYCEDCTRTSQQKKSTCPACRTPIGGLMVCKLSV